MPTELEEVSEARRFTWKDWLMRFEEAGGVPSSWEHPGSPDWYE